MQNSIVNGSLYCDESVQKLLAKDNLTSEDLSKVAWTEVEAIGRYPNLKWVYDKHCLSKFLNQDSWSGETVSLTEEELMAYKPRISLEGFAEGFKYLYPRTGGDLTFKVPKDVIVQPKIDGNQYSKDYVLLDGALVDSFTFKVAAKYGVSPLLWESVPNNEVNSDKETLILKLLEDNKFTGIVNVEYIKDYVIEMHLRVGCQQFYDICGSMVYNALTQLNTGVTPASYVQSKYERTYSKVLRINKDLTIRNNFYFSKLPDGVTSVQQYYTPNTPLSAGVNDETTFALGVINGTDLNKILEVEYELMSRIEEK